MLEEQRSTFSWTTQEATQESSLARHQSEHPTVKVYLIVAQSENFDQTSLESWNISISESNRQVSHL